ncbi:hypothetical protein D3C87_2111620 [compost metagenome]
MFVPVALLCASLMSSLTETTAAPPENSLRFNLVKPAGLPKMVLASSAEDDLPA